MFSGLSCDKAVITASFGGVFVNKGGTNEKGSSTAFNMENDVLDSSDIGEFWKSVTALTKSCLVERSM